MFKKVNNNPISIQQSILDEYQESLPDILIGLIFCGSISSANKHINDIDYLVVVSNLEYSLLPSCFDNKEHLGKRLKITLSDTIITLGEINHFSDTIQHLDGKAVQALLEATKKRNNTFTIKEHKIDIPTIDNLLIRDFSKQNFYTLSAVLRKYLIRSNYHDTSNFRLKLLKHIAVILKMKVQYTNPSYFMKTSKTISSQSKDNIDFLKNIENNKGFNSNLSIAEIYSLLPKVLDDSLFNQDI